MAILPQAAIFLGAAVVAVPLSKRLGFGAILGYLAAGLAIGPGGFGLISEVDAILHFAEFGVVLLLFVIGLELQPSRLWAMRKSVFGLGLAQVLVTAVPLALAALLYGLTVETAVIVGLSLALSSTAFALQSLAEKNELTTRHGRSAFSILLFQDLAVIPLLALIPLLAPGSGDSGASGGWIEAAKVLAVLAAVIVGGRYLLRYVLRIVAITKVREIFTAMALLTVTGTALIMESIGLSMALGAFLAGVLLADSEYRHALEADIEPFKGLLLGLFFIAVGMSLNISLIFESPLEILGWVAFLMATKGLVLVAIARTAGLTWASSRNLAAAISQGGEFAFVIFGIAVASQLMDGGLAELLIVVVTLSMAATPLVAAANTWLLARRSGPAEEPAKPIVPEENQVIIAGFGRFGQIVARILRARKIGFTALDVSAEQVDFVKRFGNKIYYGDASRLDLLRAAQADKAVIFVLAIDDVEASLQTAATVSENFPNLTIYARARNRKHAHRLMDLGVTIIRRETLNASLDLSRAVLTGLGLPASEAERTVKTFQDHDEQRLMAQHAEHNDEEKMIYMAKEAAEELEELFEQDAKAEAAE
ncbi:glutathione-regulated potassium-efflux system protein KefB [Pelagibius litoralis]|uniref:Glutathione-regulated potassium-efflux system protein KefB n=1 Tax=Pelagibius litoralis TaxID=374515 RepID=A0A967K912_9PROT|nr:monovalent cation:proton antiporter-2 (CPA2) family protein [Pelagibius litoralis]NIA70753.1 glutathione-regulated potassium-efflux system protein KefB [Pelagibius litoralis]